MTPSTDYKTKKMNYYLSLPLLIPGFDLKGNIGSQRDLRTVTNLTMQLACRDMSAAELFIISKSIHSLLSHIYFSSLPHFS